MSTAKKNIVKKIPKKNNNISISPNNIPFEDAKRNDIDRVASVEQKETAMAEMGVTRRKVYAEINTMLNAVKTVEMVRDGEIIKEDTPDMMVRAKGVELALKAFNDLKEFQAAVSTTHNKVVYQWLNVQNNVVPTRLVE